MKSLEIKVRSIWANLLKEAGAASGTSMITTLFVALVLILVGLYFVATFTPIIGNVTSPAGIAGTFMDIAKWLVPLLAIVGLILYGVTHFLGGHRR